MEIIWKDIIGFEGCYKAGDSGEIKSLERKDRLGRIVNNRLLNKVLNHQGYYRVRLSKDGKKLPCRVHRLVAVAFIPNPKNKSHVNHKDGDKLNNAADNLEWVTHTENMKHARRIGLFNK